MNSDGTITTQMHRRRMAGLLEGRCASGRYRRPQDADPHEDESSAAVSGHQRLECHTPGWPTSTPWVDNLLPIEKSPLPDSSRKTFPYRRRAEEISRSLGVPEVVSPGFSLRITAVPCPNAAQIRPAKRSVAAGHSIGAHRPSALARRAAAVSGAGRDCDASAQVRLSHGHAYRPCRHGRSRHVSRVSAVPSDRLPPYDEHHKAKHRLVAEYMKVWFAKLAQTYPQVAVIDGFASVGR